MNVKRDAISVYLLLFVRKVVWDISYKRMELLVNARKIVASAILKLIANPLKKGISLKKDWSINAKKIV